MQRAQEFLKICGMIDFDITNYTFDENPIDRLPAQFQKSCVRNGVSVKLVNYHGVMNLSEAQKSQEAGFVAACRNLFGIGNGKSARC